MMIIEDPVPAGDSVVPRDPEEQVDSSEKLFRYTFEQAAVGIGHVGPDGHWLRVNQRLCDIVGYSREELLQRTFQDITYPEDLDIDLAHARRLLAGEIQTYSLEKRYIRKDGSVVWINLTGSLARTPEGAPDYFIAIIEDIDRRKRAEEDLRLYRLMVESVQDYAIFRLDTEGHISSWNTGAQRIKGYTAEEIIGRHFSDFYPREDVARGSPQHELDVATAEGRFEGEGWRIRKDGSRFWANVVVTRLDDNHGNLIGFSKVTRDLTERRATEQRILALNTDLERRVRERTNELVVLNRELEAFSYSVSHDLRAPLRSIDGFSQILLEDYERDLDEQGREYLRRIRAATGRMSQLIDAMLDLARLSRVELRREKVDLSAIARAVATELRRTQPERQVEFHITPGLRTAADPRLLRVLLENLLGNAWKFTSKKPHATIEFGATEAGGERAYFVRDNGAGFDMAYAGKLYGVFQRLHSSAEFEGTGIGLATVHRIVHRHRGRTWAEGAVGHGATFHFTLPKEPEGA